MRAVRCVAFRLPPRIWWGLFGLGCKSEPNFLIWATYLAHITWNGDCFKVKKTNLSLWTMQVVGWKGESSKGSPQESSSVPSLPGKLGITQLYQSKVPAYALPLSCVDKTDETIHRSISLHESQNATCTTNFGWSYTIARECIEFEYWGNFIKLRWKRKA